MKGLVLSFLSTFWKCITQNEAIIDLNAVYKITVFSLAENINYFKGSNTRIFFFFHLKGNNYCKCNFRDFKYKFLTDSESITMATLLIRVYRHVSYQNEQSYLSALLQCTSLSRTDWRPAVYTYLVTVLQCVQCQVFSCRVAMGSTLYEYCLRYLFLSSVVSWCGVSLCVPLPPSFLTSSCRLCLGVGQSVCAHSLLLFISSCLLLCLCAGQLMCAPSASFFTSHAAEIRRADDDFIQHIVEVGRRDKTRATHFRPTVPSLRQRYSVF